MSNTGESKVLAQKAETRPIKSLAPRQHQRETCGRACVAFVLRALGIDATQDDIASGENPLLTYEFPIGTDHNHIVEWLSNNHDLHLSSGTDHYEGGLSIANIKSSFGSNGHYVVLLGERDHPDKPDDKMLRYYDPTHKRVFQVEKSEFETYWRNGGDDLCKWSVSLKHNFDDPSPDLYDAYPVGKPIGEQHIFRIENTYKGYAIRWVKAKLSALFKASSAEPIGVDSIETKHVPDDVSFKVVRRDPETSAAGPYNIMVSLNNQIVLPTDRVIIETVTGKIREMTGADFTQQEVEKEFLRLLGPDIPDPENSTEIYADHNDPLFVDFESFKAIIPNLRAVRSPFLYDFPHAGSDIPEHLKSDDHILGLSAEFNDSAFDPSNPESHVMHDIGVRELMLEAIEAKLFDDTVVTLDETSRLVRETNRRDKFIITPKLQSTQDVVPLNTWGLDLEIEDYMQRAAEHFWYSKTVETLLQHTQREFGKSFYVGIHSMTDKMSAAGCVGSSERADIDILHINSPELAQAALEYSRENSFLPGGKSLDVRENDSYPLTEADGSESKFGRQVMMGRYVNESRVADDAVLIEFNNKHLTDPETFKNVVEWFKGLKSYLERKVDLKPEQGVQFHASAVQQDDQDPEEITFQ